MQGVLGAESEINLIQSTRWSMLDGNVYMLGKTAIAVTPTFSAWAAYKTKQKLLSGNTTYNNR